MKRMKRHAFRRGFALSLALAAGAILMVAPSNPGTLAAEEESKAEEPGSERQEKEKGAKPKVFTNKDLLKYHGRTGRSRPPSVVIDTTQPELSTGPGEAPEGLPQDAKDRRTAELRKEIAEAEARIAALDQRERSVRNPFLPRPQLSDEERVAEAGLGSNQILERIQAERAELQGTIASLRDELARVAATPVRPRTQAPPSTPPTPPPPQP
jgi:hypothetical protein